MRALLVLLAFVSLQAQPKPADLAIVNGYVVTMDGTKRVHENGMVIIQGSRIVAVGPMTELAGKYRAARTIDAAGDIVMPGMVNTHMHAAMTVFRGLGDDVPDRLRRFIFPLERKLVDRELVYWGSLHGMVEMAQGGVTTFADMYYFEDEVARAAKKIGMRAILGETVLLGPAPDAKEPYGGFAYARKFVDSFRGDPLVTPAFAPHAPYTVNAEYLKKVQQEADLHNVPVLMHVAETTDEVENIRKEHGKTVVEYLDSLGLLTPRLVAAHCIFVSDSDIALMKERGVGVAHNLVSNIKGGRAVAPALKMFRAGARVGLGTDGPMSGNTLDIIGQLGYVAKVHKLAAQNRNVMPAVDVVEMATMGGARALHMEKEIGSLEAGKLADVVLIDRSNPVMTPFYDVYSTLVYAASPRDVKTTIIHGKPVMENRRMMTVNPAEARERVRGFEKKISATVAAGIVE